MKTPTKEITNTCVESPVYSRFDFEQQLMNCWNVVDDLKATLNCRNQNELVEAIAVLYQHKFERCFETFEQLLRAKQI
jgi:flagellin-specific chaperone FliS